MLIYILRVQKLIHFTFCVGMEHHHSVSNRKFRTLAHPKPDQTLIVIRSGTAWPQSSISLIISTTRWRASGSPPSSSVPPPLSGMIIQPLRPPKAGNRIKKVYSDTTTKLGFFFWGQFHSSYFRMDRTRTHFGLGFFFHFLILHGKPHILWKNYTKKASLKANYKVTKM